MRRRRIYLLKGYFNRKERAAQKAAKDSIDAKANVQKEIDERKK